MSYRDLEIGEILFPDDEDDIIWGEVYPPDPDYGHLYVVEFDSGWVKVGKTSNWRTRLASHRREYRRWYGWSVVDQWYSCLVSDIRDDRRRSSGLCSIEWRLLRYAGAVSDGQQLNPWTPAVGRDKSRPAETELFHDCDFGTLCAYADVLALCDAVR
ncbi:hypothetical protein [Nocardia vinacea]|uniref:hypothetical protein n=1 Tax=Nocardia vinacea TaxID=96468 RepID=UPI00030041EB|nr:hypothetical protein [Nocardia vinacea]